MSPTRSFRVCSLVAGVLAFGTTALGGCGSKSGVVSVHVGSVSPLHLTSLSVTLSYGGKTAPAVSVPVTGGVLPPTVAFSLRFAPEVSGAVHITVQPVGATEAAAPIDTTIDVSPGQVTSRNLEFGGNNNPVDMAVAPDAGADGGVDAGSLGWRVLMDAPQRTAFNTVFATPTAVWVAGAIFDQNDDPSGTVVLRSTDHGATWQHDEPLCGSDVASASWVDAASQEVYIGCNYGVIYHKKAGKWTCEAVTASAPGYVAGIWGSSPTDVYAVIAADGSIYHTDGSGQWTQQTNPLMLANSVWGLGASNIWVTGDNGALVHSTGDGKWTAVTVGTTDNLYFIRGTSPTDLWLGAGSGVLLRQAGAGWTPRMTFADPLIDAYQPPGGAILHIAAGTLMPNDGKGYFTGNGGADWSSEFTFRQQISNISGASANEIYAVVSDGTAVLAGP